MAKKEKSDKDESVGIDEFADILIKDLNKNSNDRVAYNLAKDISPTHIKQWISTGSKLLDYAISNKCNGGFPVGRIVEVFGAASVGKSHLALQVAKNCQKMGGIVIYVDTENASSPENIASLGVDVSKRFVFVEESCIESVFEIIESTIIKTKNLSKDVPVLVIWDSIAATSPAQELNGTYEQNLIGVGARALSKGFRKITQIIGNQNVLLLCLNQTRIAIGQLFGDPEIASGGKALSFYSSVRIKLTPSGQIKDKNEQVIGVGVGAKTIKNKVAVPFRKVNFEIIFGQGIRENEQIFDLMRENGPETINGKILSISGESQWKTFSVIEQKGKIILEKKFHKEQFGDLMKDPKYSEYLNQLLEEIMIKKIPKQEIDTESYAEVQALSDELLD